MENQGALERINFEGMMQGIVTSTSGQSLYVRIPKIMWNTFIKTQVTHSLKINDSTVNGSTVIINSILVKPAHSVGRVPRNGETVIVFFLGGDPKNAYYMPPVS